jgi:hypothetical protein
VRNYSLKIQARASFSPHLENLSCELRSTRLKIVSIESINELDLTLHYKAPEVFSGGLFTDFFIFSADFTK